ncbi:MAG: hypothetical protein IKT35_03745, partial [Clostridia bacterium]|nr:hypothetical protein [Clostridia bacterium]
MYPLFSGQKIGWGEKFGKNRDFIVKISRTEIYNFGVVEPMLNVKTVKLGTNERITFSKIDEILEMPNLIEIQKKSYKWFVEEGLHEVFDGMEPICDYTNNLELS